jgi:hypothetical protein
MGSQREELMSDDFLQSGLSNDSRGGSCIDRSMETSRPPKLQIICACPYPPFSRREYLWFVDFGYGDIFIVGRVSETPHLQVLTWLFWHHQDLRNQFLLKRRSATEVIQ